MTTHLAHTFTHAAESHRHARLATGDGKQGTTTSLQDLLQLHGEGSTAVILMILAACCVLPVSGVGTVLSPAMVLLAWRWAQQRETSHLPERIGRVRLNETWTARVLHGFAWMYRTASRCLRPRLSALTEDRMRPWWALWISLMAFLVFLPIPFGNVLPALSLVMLCLGWMFRDGAALILSKLVGLGAFGFAFAFGHLLVEGFEQFKNWAFA